MDEPHSATLSEPTSRARSDYGQVVALLMAVSFVCYVGRVSITTAGNMRIMDQYQIPPVQMGSVYSAFLLVYMICMIPGGWVIDRFGPRKALLLVAGGSSVFVALTGVVGWTLSDGQAVFMALLLVRGLMGMVSAPLYPSCASAVGRWIPAEARSRTNGLVTGAALVGVAFTPTLIGVMIDRLDWPLTFVIWAGVTLATALAWFVGTADREGGEEELDERKEPVRLEDWLRLIRDRRLLLITLSYGAVGYFQYLFFYWMSFYFDKILKLPEEKSRLYAAIPPLAMAVGMPLGGWLGDRLEQARGRSARRIVPMAGMAAGGLFLIAGVFTKEPVWIVTWFSLALGAVGAAEGPFWVTAVEFGGRKAGSAAAFFNTGGNAGGMLAPVLTPLVGERFGWPWALALGGAICLGGFLLWLGIDVGGRGESTSDPERSDSPISS